LEIKYLITFIDVNQTWQAWARGEVIKFWC